MSAIDRISDARELILSKFGNLTGDDVDELNRWTKQIKKAESYKKLRDNPAFRDFLAKVKSQLAAAIATINNRDSEEQARADAFVIRDCWLFVLDLFGEGVEKELEHIENEISGRIAIIEKGDERFRRVV